MLSATRSSEGGANEKDATKAVLSVVEGILELAESMKVRKRHTSALLAQLVHRVAI